MRKFAALYETKEMYDTIICFDSDKGLPEIRSHATVLAASSEKFKKQLTVPELIKKKDDKHLLTITLDSENDYRLFEAILKYCYTETVTDSDVGAEDIQQRAEVVDRWGKFAQLADELGVEEAVCYGLSNVFRWVPLIDAYWIQWETVKLALVRPEFSLDRNVEAAVFAHAQYQTEAIDWIVEKFGDLGREQRIHDIMHLPFGALADFLNHPNIRASENQVAILVGHILLLSGYKMTPEKATLASQVRWTYVSPTVREYVFSEVPCLAALSERDSRHIRRDSGRFGERAPSSISQVVFSGDTIGWRKFMGCRIRCFFQDNAVKVMVYGFCNEETSIVVSGSAWYSDSNGGKQCVKSIENNCVNWDDNEIPAEFISDFHPPINVCVTGFK
jgi:hypothetical protein